MDDLQDGPERRVSNNVRREAKKASRLEHRWLVLISACVAYAVAVSFPYTFGTFLLDILEMYSQSRAYSVLIQAVMIGVTFCAGVPNGVLVNRLGPQKCGVLGGILLTVGTAASYFSFSVLYLIISFGLIAGWGISLLFLSSTVANGQHFVGSWKLLGLSLMNGTSGVTLVLYPYIMSSLVSQYGLRWTFLILSGLLMNTVPTAALWESGSTGSGGSVTQQTWNDYKKHMKNLSKRITFILFVLSVIFSLAALNSFVPLCFDLFRYKGFSSSNSLQLYLAFNVCNVIGRFTPGFLKLIPRLGSMWVLTSFLLVLEIGFIGISLSYNFQTTIVFCAGLGFGTGGLAGAVLTVIAKETKPESFNAGTASVMTAIGLSNSLAGPLGGMIYDRTQSYDIVLYTCSAGVFCGLLCSIGGSILKSMQRKKRIASRDDTIFTVTRF